MRETTSQQGLLIYQRVASVSSGLLKSIMSLSKGDLSEVWKKGSRKEFDDLGAQGPLICQEVSYNTSTIGSSMVRSERVGLRTLTVARL
jgi:hypothetical protein